jgi:hypothetical protein
LRAGGDHQHVAGVDLAAVSGEAEGLLLELGLDDVVLDHFGADMDGLGAHLVHQPGALDDVCEARVVFHVRGDGELAAGLQARDQHRLAQGARGVDGGGVARRPRAEDDDLRMARGGHGSVLCWPFLASLSGRANGASCASPVILGMRGA